MVVYDLIQRRDMVCLVQLLAETLLHLELRFLNPLYLLFGLLLPQNLVAIANFTLALVDLGQVELRPVVTNWRLELLKPFFLFFEEITGNALKVLG